MIFSYSWLQSFFKKKLPKPEKLAEILTNHSFEVKETKKHGKDYIFNIDVLPNRGPDCFSHLGIARECSVLTGAPFKTLNFKPKEENNIKASDFLSVQVKNKAACSRYTARVIYDVKVSFSPKWIRERLQSCGLRSINNVVDIANYVMLETGQPLHAFDFDKLENLNSNIRLPKKIIVRFAKKGEKIVTLDEEKYDLDDDILIIADAKKPLAIAGIKGGKGAEIDFKTNKVVLEAASFNPQIIRRASKRIDLKTDASWRFEHGLDPNLTEFAINRAAYLIQESAYSGDGNPKTAQGLIDIYPKKVLPKKIKLDLNYVRRLLGVKISQDAIIKILKSLGLKIENCKMEILDVVVPTFRLDILMPEDLIEEIGRVYGYQKIAAQFPIASLIPPKRNLTVFWEDMIKDILKETGLTEVYNYSFLSPEQLSIFNFRHSKIIEVENPISVEQRYLRPSLIPNLLKNVEKNQNNFSDIQIFELGKIYLKDKIRERRMLTGLMTGDKFYQAKGTVDSLLQKLGISNIRFVEPSLISSSKKEDSRKSLAKEEKNSIISIWQPNKSAEIKIDEESIGSLGEISSKILEATKIKTKVVIFDLDFEKLIKLASEEHEYLPISRFPAAIRDLAILVPRTIKVEEVLEKIETVGGPLIRDIDLFDIYEGEELPYGKKNLAFHIIYQAENRTLTSEEIDEIQNKIIKLLEQKPEWQVRK